MNFPMMQPIFQFFYWLVNTPGLGGVVLVVLVLCVSLAALSALNWISAGSRADESETYSHPSPSLFHEEEADE